ncbi:MAG: hypothetical protein ACTTGJ_00825 [Clostridium sp.]
MLSIINKVINTQIKPSVKDLFDLRIFNENKISKKIIYNIIILILSLSAGVFSVQLINGDIFGKEKVIGTIATFLFSFVITMMYGEKLLKSNIKDFKIAIIFNIIIGIFAIIVIKKMYMFQHSTTYVNKLQSKQFFNRFNLKFFAISSFIIIMLFVYVLNRIRDDIKFMLNKLDVWDKRAYIVATILSIVLIIGIYSLSVGWYYTYDSVYSIDSKWIFKDIIRESHYYDVRHPILNIFVFPVWAIVNTVLDTLNSTILHLGEDTFRYVEAVILQIVNAQLLILIALKLKILTGNRKVFILYMVSFATLTYTLFFEKYQLITFLLVNYVFLTCFKKQNIKALVSSILVMPTTAVISIAEVLDIHKETLKEDIKKLIIKGVKVLVVLVAFLIIFGRMSVFINGKRDVIKMRKQFTAVISTEERINATNNMFHSSITPFKANITIENKYLWENLSKKSSILSISVIILSIIGFVSNSKKLIYKISMAWLIFAYVLFVLLKWSPDETPLFNIYFSWAIIVLLVAGIDTIINKLSIVINNIYNKVEKDKVEKILNILIYTVIIVAILIANFKEVYTIYNFLDSIKELINVTE